MFDTLNQVNWLKVGLVLAALLLVAFVAIYLFNVPLNTIVWITLIGGFAWMHMGMHGSHGGHGGHTARDNAKGDEHAGHIAQTTNGAAQLDEGASNQHTHRGC